ncbi:hypothetical protein TEA_028828 [Camellia sinensis var. sinensis]|uniref:Uncharacterized protein n=1 Tax=Camellia sinensis var. sinensis TaxID=542762 RepID=A0A4S4E4X0_CAMSN|nr:hypothetical protein TEA_028828 [Camellia sinensis var. sinensis]
MEALKKLSVPKDSPLCDIGDLDVPIPSSPNQSGDEAKEEESDAEEIQGKDTEAEDAEEENEVGARAKSPTLNDQVLDLTEKDDDEVSKSTSPNKAEVSKAKILAVEKSLDQTLQEIDAEVALEADSRKSQNDEAQAST